MKTAFLTFALLLTLMSACERRRMSEAVGSGAGIETIEPADTEREEALGQGTDDMNITTPIDERPELEELEEVERAEDI